MLDVMYANAPYTVIRRAMHMHPTVSQLIPTMLSGKAVEVNGIVATSRTS